MATWGNELFGDFTALYKIGKWQIGPVAYFEAQTTNDKPGGGVACTPALAAINRKSRSALWLVTTSARSRCKRGSTIPSNARTRSAVSTYGAA